MNRDLAERDWERARNRVVSQSWVVEDAKNNEDPKILADAESRLRLEQYAEERAWEVRQMWRRWTASLDA